MVNCRPLLEYELKYVEDNIALAGAIIQKSEPLEFSDLQEIYDMLLAEHEPVAQFVAALGYAFGQKFVQHDWLEWAMLDDEYGKEIGIQVLGRSLTCTPVSMIQYRLEDRESWNLRELMETTVTHLRQMGQKAALD